MREARDHGGGIDAAIAEFGGTRADWIDLSTGINPAPYPLPNIEAQAWTTLPDNAAISQLEEAARQFWHVPDEMEVVAAGGASALIAAMPRVLEGTTVHIPAPTYNEHRAAFIADGWEEQPQADVTVLVHPNNPDGRFWDELPNDISGQLIIDESFCDIAPTRSFLRGYSPSRVDMENNLNPMRYAKNPEAPPIILKSFGKFWGLAGLRLGFAICTPTIATTLREQLGPWAVSGPACQIGTRALKDKAWADQTRQSLHAAALRLDSLLAQYGLNTIGGTDLFRLVSTQNAQATQTHLARHHILTRIFPYSDTWVRFGLPGGQNQWDRLETALNTLP